MKKTIKDFDLNNKKVIIRCDFNVPIQNGLILDDNRIVQSIETIKYALNHNAKIILMSHLGRIKNKTDLSKNNLEPVAKRLSTLLKKEVIFINNTRGKKLENAIQKMKPKDIILLQNTRYEDLDGQKESTNNKKLGKYWSSLGDIFINDAFGTCHREHASNVGISSNIPSGLGLLVIKEMKMLNKIKSPKKPFVLLLGGSKVKDKIKIVDNLIQKADYILIGGGMSYTFIKASGFNIGSSMLDKESLNFCHKILKEYGNKIILPVDTIVSDSLKSENHRQCFVNEIKENEIGLDIGPKTIQLFMKYLKNAKTIFWNGPLGMFELKQYENGTKKILNYISKTNAITVIGGGDTSSAAIQLGYRDKFTHISTGGGASLEYLSGQTLPGIGSIDEI